MSDPYTEEQLKAVRHAIRAMRRLNLVRMSPSRFGITSEFGFYGYKVEGGLRALLEERLDYTVGIDTL